MIISERSRSESYRGTGEVQLIFVYETNLIERRGTQTPLKTPVGQHISDLYLLSHPYDWISLAHTLRRIAKTAKCRLSVYPWVTSLIEYSCNKWITLIYVFSVSSILRISILKLECADALFVPHAIEHTLIQVSLPPILTCLIIWQKCNFKFWRIKFVLYGTSKFPLSPESGMVKLFLIL